MLLWLWIQLKLQDLLPLFSMMDASKSETLNPQINSLLSLFSTLLLTLVPQLLLLINSIVPPNIPKDGKIFVLNPLLLLTCKMD
jgi:histidine ammonia-lyase